MQKTTAGAGPHQEQPLLQAGTSLEKAKAAMILVHGRGADARSILTLAPEFERKDIAYLAPQASGYTWYPYSFLAPMAQNEPGLSSGLRVLADTVAMVEQSGMAATQIMLLGFSQGACLTLEFAARHARRYGAVIGLSGGLIGPDGTPRDYAGDFAGTPVFLGCATPDPHVPEARIHETADVLQRMGAAVQKEIYPGMGHTVSQDEIRIVRSLIEQVVEAAPRKL